jgi:hypothetical protein
MLLRLASPPSAPSIETNITQHLPLRDQAAARNFRPALLQVLRFPCS